MSSTEGRGTTFTVALPPAEKRIPGLVQASGAAQQAAGSASPSKARVLVVDDDPHVARAIQRALRDEDVRTASSGEEAIALLHAEPFDLVVCDVMMPEMTGMELHERLSAAWPGLERRMIFVTGGVFTPEATDFLARVPNPRLEKPFDVEALRAMVRDLVASEVAGEPWNARDDREGVRPCGEARPIGTPPPVNSVAPVKWQ